MTLYVLSALSRPGTPSQSTTTEDIQSPPSIAPQGEQQFDQDGVQAERARLTAAYEKEDESFSPVNSRFKISMQQITDLKDKMNSIATRLKETDLDDNDKLELKKEHRDVKAKLDVLIAEYNEQLSEFIKIGTACFLKKQTDHFPKRIENLFAKLKEIKANEAPPSDDLKARTNELEDRIRRLGVQHEIAKDILQKHEQSRSVGARIRGFFNSCLPNGK
ncbi:hypothetical protein BASA61_004000 [Batrachochytrium salamandrivorans]|nr:hypothetical protein BASA61_004000 [Batrachochytrium salamandrivorans]